MAIEATVARGYTWRTIIVGVVCLVFGVWGVWDYAIDIPRRQMAMERGALLELCRDALQTEQSAGKLTPEAVAARDAINEEMARIFAQEFTDDNPDTASMTPQQIRQEIQNVGAALESSEAGRWLAFLGGIMQGLVAERHLPLTSSNYPKANAAFEGVQKQLEEIGQVIAPGKYDRAIQWAFILCLPCVPYFFWIYLTVSRQRYRLDDDGTLHMPEGTWSAEQIADIDMGRWMARSIAWVVNEDGTRVKLDDYKFSNLHLIIGALASRLHPGDWSAEAKPLDRQGTTGSTPAEPAQDAEEPRESGIATDGG